MIAISPQAKEKLIALQQEENAAQAKYLHIAVKGGGCSGLLYEMNFVPTPNDTDQVQELEGVQLAIDKHSLLYLMGVTLDFSDGLNGKGFHFINPKATRTCGCGESFSL